MYTVLTLKQEQYGTKQTTGMEQGDLLYWSNPVPRFTLCRSLQLPFLSDGKPTYREFHPFSSSTERQLDYNLQYYHYPIPQLPAQCR